MPDCMSKQYSNFCYAVVVNILLGPKTHPDSRIGKATSLSIQGGEPWRRR